MPVSNFNVFCFRIIKKPFISSLWYVLLFYTIWNPKDLLPSILGILFLLLSFTKFSFVLALLSPIPCIAEIIVSRNVFIDNKPTIILIVGIVWLVIWYIAMCVWKNIMNNKYVIDPNTHVLYRNPYK